MTRAKTNPLAPSAGLLAKLGSIIVHFDEGGTADGSEGGHPFDWTAARTLLTDGEVRTWLKGMDAAALLPKRRNAKR